MSEYRASTTRELGAVDYSTWPAGFWVYPYIAAAAAGVLGALGLIGWYFNVQPLRTSWSEGQVMKANAAGGLLLLGISLVLLLPRRPGQWARSVGRALAAGVTLLGLFTLLEAVAGIDLRIDGLLVGAEWSDAGLAAQRMSAPTAIAFIASGLAVLLLDARVLSVRPADVLGVVVIIAGAIPFVGYLYGAARLYGDTGWSDVAVQSALAVIAAGCAILLARPEQGLVSVVIDTGTAGTIVRRLILPILLFPLLVGWVQVRVLRTNFVEHQFVAVLGTVLIVSVLLSLLLGFGRRLSVAERERAEASEDVRRAQERLSMALVGAQAGAMDWDLAADTISWSRESSLLYGLGPRGLPGNYGDWLALVHPDDRPVISRAIDKAMAGGDVDMQFRVIGEDGDARWFRANGRVLRDLDGKPIRFTGITRDVTSEKFNEIQLRRTAQRLELLYNTTMSILGTEDAQQAARAVCERVLTHLDCQVMLNYVISETRPDHIQLYSWAGISNEQAKTWSRMHINEIISGTVVRDGTRIVVEDLPSHPMDARTNVIRDLEMLAYACHPLITNGKVIGTIGFGSRTTRRFPLETLALMQAVANHIALAIQRSRASQELAKAKAWQQRFMSVLSQELRMPLTPIIVATQMLESDPQFRDSAREQISMIRRNAEVEARLIDDLLDITRLNARQLSIRRDRVSLHDAIRSAVEICWPDARERQLILATDLVAEHDTVEGDAARLQQALWHMLRNAVRFTPAKGTVALKTENPEPGRICVRIRGTGGRLGPEEQQPFTAGDLSAGQDSGEQLSLAISRGLIELHGGEISVGGAETQGTSLELSLPLVDRPAAATKVPPANVARASRVLIVDDHADTSRVLKRLLGGLGHDVQSATTVAEALEHARQQAFDLLISDISLPDGTGIELLRRLREAQPIRAIAISGHALDEDLRRSINAGFSAHLTKPLSVDQLQSAMAQALGEPAGTTISAG